MTALLGEFEATHDVEGTCRLRLNINISNTGACAFLNRTFSRYVKFFCTLLHVSFMFKIEAQPSSTLLEGNWLFLLILGSHIKLVKFLEEHLSLILCLFVFIFDFII